MMWWVLLACGGVDPAAERAPTDPAAATDPPTADALVVLSLNLHCLHTDGTDFTDNPSRFAAIAALVADEDVDVLALQEACVRPGEDAVALLGEALTAATGEAWSSEWAFAHVAWEGTEDEADEGVAIVSRLPIADPWPLTYFQQAGLQRVALGATVDGTTIVTVHLDHQDAPARVGQSRQTATAALTLAPSFDIVLAGDFNDRPGTDAHEAPVAMGFVDASDGLPDDRIDYVFAHRGGRWATRSARLVFDGEPWPVVSDHPGVLVRFEATAPAPVTVTRIVANADVGWGHWLAVRGDTAPLDWDLGWPMHPAEPDRWELVLTEIDAPFAFKVLVDDATWQTGDDVAGEPGAENTVVPVFP